MGDLNRTDEPHDRLTRLCAAMTDALMAHPETTDEIRCAVFLSDDRVGGLQIYGYDDDSEAVVDVLMHVRAIMRSNGKDLQIHAVGQG
jgi:hypothetical protein